MWAEIRVFRSIYSRCFILSSCGAGRLGFIRLEDWSLELWDLSAGRSQLSLSELEWEHGSEDTGDVGTFLRFPFRFGLFLLKVLGWNSSREGEHEIQDFFEVWRASCSTSLSSEDVVGDELRWWPLFKRDWGLDPRVAPLLFDLVCCYDLDVVPANFPEISFSISGAMDFKMSLEAWGTPGVVGTDTTDDFFYLSSGAGLVLAVLAWPGAK